MKAHTENNYFLYGKQNTDRKLAKRTREGMGRHKKERARPVVNRVTFPTSESWTKSVQTSATINIGNLLLDVKRKNYFSGPAGT